MNNRKIIVMAQQNLQHKYTATISCFSDAQKNGVDVLLFQDPYVHKIRGQFVLPISTAKYRLVARQEQAFTACVLILNDRIDVLKLNQLTDQYASMAILRLDGIDLKVGSAYWPPSMEEQELIRQLDKIEACRD